MKQAARLTNKPTRALPQQQPIAAPPVTIWAALAEKERLPLLKQLAELIRRAKELPPINAGGSNEAN